MGIHATEDLTALIACKDEPYRAGLYDFDDFVVIHLKWSEGHTGDLSLMHYEGRRHETMDWNAARLFCLERMKSGDMVKLLGRVYN